MGRASRAKATLRNSDGITLRLARRGEGQSVLGLYELIDLSPAERAALSSVVPAIDEGFTRPPEFGLELSLVAVDRTGQVLGAASACAPMEWTRFDNEALNSALRRSLVEVTQLAVIPHARGRGIGRRLLGAAEHEAARRGYGLAEVTYSRNAETRLGGFYRAAGYTELDAEEPLCVLYGQTVVTLPYDHDSRVAIKPLRPEVTITPLPGHSALDRPRLVRGLVVPAAAAASMAPARA